VREVLGSDAAFNLDADFDLRAAMDLPTACALRDRFDLLLLRDDAARVFETRAFFFRADALRARLDLFATP
jgi:hypothetical protein